MILVHPKLGKSFSITTTKNILKINVIAKINGHVRLHQDPYSEKRKREPTPIPIVETGSTKPSFKNVNEKWIH